MIYAIPTDTCYGLACSLFDEEGYYRIYTMKGRDFDKPLAILLKTYEDLKNFTHISPEQISFLRSYPHPFTLLVTPSKNFVYPVYMDQVRYSKIAFRIAEKCLSKEIQSKVSYPLFLTSANKSNEKEAYTSQEVFEIFSVWVDDIDITSGSISPDNPPSDIFEFMGNTIDIHYLRKNHK